MKVFKSKIDYWWGIPLVYPIFMSVTSIVEGEWLGWLLLVGIVLFIWLISWSTRYIIDGNQLIVKCLFVVNDTIEITKIRKIEKTNSVLSSPALSLDRIAIRYNKFDEVYLSPKERQLFIDELVAIHPEIEVTL